MPSNTDGKRDWNAVLQWSVPFALVVLGILAYSFTSRAVNEARDYTDWAVNEAVNSASYYPLANGKVMEEKIANVITRLDRIEGKLDRVLEKLDK